jgi:hypothetical protein
MKKERQTNLPTVITFNQRHPIAFQIAVIILTALCTFTVMTLDNTTEASKKQSISAKLVSLELKKMDGLSSAKYKESNQIIENLNQNKLDQVPLYSLNDQITTMSESEWMSNMSNLVERIEPEEYYFLLAYHKSFQKFDTEYPIKSFYATKEQQKDQLLFWWESFKNVYPTFNTSEKTAIVTKIDALSK